MKNIKVRIAIGSKLEVVNFCGSLYCKNYASYATAYFIAEVFHNIFNISTESISIIAPTSYEDVSKLIGEDHMVYHPDFLANSNTDYFNISLEQANEYLIKVPEDQILNEFNKNYFSDESTDCILFMLDSDNAKGFGNYNAREIVNAISSIPHKRLFVFNDFESSGVISNYIKINEELNAIKTKDINDEMINNVLLVSQILVTSYFDVDKCSRIIERINNIEYDAIINAFIEVTGYKGDKPSTIDFKSIFIKVLHLSSSHYFKEDNILSELERYDYSCFKQMVKDNPKVPIAEIIEKHPKCKEIEKIMLSSNCDNPISFTFVIDVLSLLHIKTFNDLVDFGIAVRSFSFSQWSHIKELREGINETNLSNLKRIMKEYSMSTGKSETDICHLLSNLSSTIGDSNFQSINMKECFIASSSKAGSNNIAHKGIEIEDDGFKMRCHPGLVGSSIFLFHFIASNIENIHVYCSYDIKEIDSKQKPCFINIGNLKSPMELPEHVKKISDLEEYDPREKKYKSEKIKLNRRLYSLFLDVVQSDLLQFTPFDTLCSSFDERVGEKFIDKWNLSIGSDALKFDLNYIECEIFDASSTENMFMFFIKESEKEKIVNNRFISKYCNSISNFGISNIPFFNDLLIAFKTGLSEMFNEE